MKTSLFMTGPEHIYKIASPSAVSTVTCISLKLVLSIIAIENCMWKDSAVHTPSKILPGPVLYMASMEYIARAAEPCAPSGCRVCRVVKGDHRVMKNDGIW